MVWSPSAESDFESILNYLTLNWNNKIVNRFINKVDDTIDLILKDPKTFPLVNIDLQVRKSVISKHNTIYYREKAQKIEIIRLFDSRQDPNQLKF